MNGGGTGNVFPGARQWPCDWTGESPVPPCAVTRGSVPLQAWTGNAAGFPEDVGKLRANINPNVPIYVDNWKNGCNNPVTQRCPYVNSLALYSPPAFMTIGNAPRVMDYIRMPHQTKYNMAILKEFPIHEQIRLAFRAELYGALNHVYFGANGNNFTIYQNLDYSRGGTPSATSHNIGGTRNIQLGLKLYF